MHTDRIRYDSPMIRSTGHGFTTRADASHPALTTSHPHRMDNGTVTTGMIVTPTTQSKWRQTIKRRCRANDLDALRLSFAVKINDKWNDDLRKDHS